MRCRLSSFSSVLTSALFSFPSPPPFSPRHPSPSPLFSCKCPFSFSPPPSLHSGKKKFRFLSSVFVWIQPPPPPFPRFSCPKPGRQNGEEGNPGDDATCTRAGQKCALLRRKERAKFFFSRHFRKSFGERNRDEREGKVKLGRRSENRLKNFAGACYFRSADTFNFPLLGRNGERNF